MYLKATAASKSPCSMHYNNAAVQNDGIVLRQVKKLYKRENSKLMKSSEEESRMDLSGVSVP